MLISDERTSGKTCGLVVVAGVVPAKAPVGDPSLDCTMNEQPTVCHVGSGFVQTGERLVGVVVVRAIRCRPAPDPQSLQLEVVVVGRLSLSLDWPP